MKRRIKQAANRILELQGEFSAEELLGAMKFLMESDLGKKSGVSITRTRKAKGKKRTRSRRPLADSVSRAVIALKDDEPEKYQILEAFDTLVRSGKALPKLESVRVLGASIDKNFTPGKSRRAAIPKLVRLLAGLPVEDLKIVVERALEDDEVAQKEDESYRELASFLIRGREQ